MDHGKKSKKVIRKNLKSKAKQKQKDKRKNKGSNNDVSVDQTMFGLNMKTDKEKLIAYIDQTIEQQF